jgi:hypothetical protein
MVEIVAGDNWLITCWHRERILKGVREEIAAGSVPTSTRDAVINSVCERWSKLEGRPTAGDLGILLLQESTKDYEQARLTLSSWLDAWELEFYDWSMDSNPDPSALDQHALVNLRAMVAEFKRCVTPLGAAYGQAHVHWFDCVTIQGDADHLDEAFGRTLRALELLGDRIRGAFDLVHLQVSQAQDRNTLKLQDLLGKVTALLVVPALVAAFFGANTWLPGGNDVHAHVSFYIMVVAMVLGVIIAWAFLKRHDRT